MAANRTFEEKVKELQETLVSEGFEVDFLKSKCLAKEVLQPLSDSTSRGLLAEDYEESEEEEETDIPAIESFMDILLEGGECVDVKVDTWGAVIYMLLKSLGDLYSLLFCTYWYVSQPVVENLQRSYAKFHYTCFDSEGNEALESWDNEMPDDDKNRLCGAVLRYPYFLGVVCALWSLATLTEVVNIVSMIRTMLAVPKLPPGIPYADMVIEMKTTADLRGSAARIVAVPTTVRVVLLMTTAIPRIAITASLFYLGLRWLFSTSDFENLLLNGLALQFIITIPDLVVTSIVSPSIQSAIQGMAFVIPKGLMTGEKAFVKEFMITKLCFLGVLAFIVCYVWHGGNTILPGYNGDLEIVCKHHDVAMSMTKCVFEQCFPYGEKPAWITKIQR